MTFFCRFFIVIFTLSLASDLCFKTNELCRRKIATRSERETERDRDRETERDRDRDRQTIKKDGDKGREGGGVYRKRPGGGGGRE